MIDKDLIYTSYQQSSRDELMRSIEHGKQRCGKQEEDQYHRINAPNVPIPGPFSATEPEQRGNGIEHNQIPVPRTAE